MGCIKSKVKFICNSKYPGQDESVQKLFLHLGYEENDIQLLYRVFSLIDANSSGTIQPSELLFYFKLEDHKFERDIFAFFDEDKSGNLNFMEFGVTMWNLLTLPDQSLGVLMYLMKEPTGKLRILYNQVRDILEVAHRKKLETSGALMTIYNNMKKDFVGELSLMEFIKWTGNNISLITPLAMLQINLRKQIFGERFWEKLSFERFENAEVKQFIYIVTLQNIVKQINEEYRRQKLLDDATKCKGLQSLDLRSNRILENVKAKSSPIDRDRMKSSNNNSPTSHHSTRSSKTSSIYIAEDQAHDHDHKKRSSSVTTSSRKR